MVCNVQNNVRTMRRAAMMILGLCVCAPAFAATLEKLTLSQMAQQSTMIVRGRVTGCAGETRGAIIYTRCGVAVTETWKGTPKSRVEFLVPGGRFQNLTQTFTGAPKFGANEQYVLFLWVGRSGVPQIIGLSQGVFDISLSTTGTPLVRREPTTEMMVDSKGKQVRDEGISMTVSALRGLVDQALTGSVQK
jgi:hypothetical protein